MSDTDIWIRPNWFFRIVHLLLLVICGGSIIGIGYFTFVETISHEDMSFPWLFMIFLLLLSPVFVSISLTLFFRPSSLRIRNSDVLWTLYTLIKPTKSFRIQDIRGFSTSEVLVGEGWESWPSRLLLILYFKDGHVEEVSGFSVQRIGMLLKILKENGVNQFGEEATWYPFKRRNYKFTK
jgi:hypothetical protein